jgi:hypothetical protein
MRRSKNISSPDIKMPCKRSCGKSCGKSKAAGSCKGSAAKESFDPEKTVAFSTITEKFGDVNLIELVKISDQLLEKSEGVAAPSRCSKRSAPKLWGWLDKNWEELSKVVSSVNIAKEEKITK